MGLGRQVVCLSNFPSAENISRAGAFAKILVTVSRLYKTVRVRVGGLWRSLVSASVWGTEGRRFKSSQPDKKTGLFFFELVVVAVRVVITFVVVVFVNKDAVFT